MYDHIADIFTVSDLPHDFWGVWSSPVHCRNVEHLNDQRKRRNSISKAAGFLRHVS